MPRPPAVSNELLVDADACARAGSTIERHFSLAELPRLQAAGVLDGSQVDVRLRFSLFDERPAIDGALSGTIRMSCQRCMQPVAVPIDERFQVVVMSAESADEPGGYEQVDVDAAHFDLRWLAEEQALLAMPLVPLHAAGECDEIAAPPPDVQRGEQAVQKPFQNLRDLLEK